MCWQAELTYFSTIEYWALLIFFLIIQYTLPSKRKALVIVIYTYTVKPVLRGHIWGKENLVL
jgi:hypothetical protein